LLVCEFQENDFNNTKEFTMLEDCDFKPTELASICAEMGEWLSEVHYHLVF